MWKSVLLGSKVQVAMHIKFIAVIGAICHKQVFVKLSCCEEEFVDRPNRLQSSKSATGASGTQQDDAGEKDLEQYLIRLSNHWVIAVSGRRASFARISNFSGQNRKMVAKYNEKVTGHHENVSSQQRWGWSAWWDGQRDDGQDRATLAGLDSVDDSTRILTFGKRSNIHFFRTSFHVWILDILGWNVQNPCQGSKLKTSFLNLRVFVVGCMNNSTNCAIAAGWLRGNPSIELHSSNGSLCKAHFVGRTRRCQAEWPRHGEIFWFVNDVDKEGSWCFRFQHFGTCWKIGGNRGSDFFYPKCFPDLTSTGPAGCARELWCLRRELCGRHEVDLQ